MARKTYEQLRSHRWCGVDTLRAFGHRSRAKQMGVSRRDFEGKPVIGILNTWSDMRSTSPRPMKAATSTF